MSDKICEICKNPIEECEEIISCPDCGKEFHKKCWRLTGKCCVNEECRQKGRERKEAEKQKKEKVLAEQNTETEKSVKFCPKCGKELNDEEIFCGKCGEPVSKEPEVPKKRICSKCGRELNDEEVFCCKCGIEYNDTPVTKNANKKPIYKRKWFAISAACVCAVALISIIAGVISANQVEPCAVHSWDTVEVIKEATCTEQGLEKQKCSCCKEKREHVVPAKGHRCKTTVLKEKTCTENGIEELVCSVCGHKETKDILGCHNWINATCTKPKTCSVCGKTEGNKLEHEYSQGKCINCGQDIPMTTYKGIKVPQMPYTEHGVTFVSVEGLTLDDSIQIRVRNDGIDYDNRFKEIYYKLYSADGTVLTSNYSYLESISVGETTIIQFSLSNTNYKLKKVLLSTVPFD